MDYNQIEEKVRSFLVEELEIDENKISPDARLAEDLGIDSLEVVDVVVMVESEFGFKMKPEDFKSLKTFSQFCTFVHERTQ
ncbi:MAG: acyl carrier protein [Bacteroidales bacterium]|nr:acyl carrier protein [Bacteroidales bacterium]